MGHRVVSSYELVVELAESHTVTLQTEGPNPISTTCSHTVHQGLLSVTSHLSGRVLYLEGCGLMVDDGGMETTGHIYRYVCSKCERPALTFDEKDEPLCGRHATIFVAAPRVETKYSEPWMPMVVEASV